MTFQVLQGDCVELMAAMPAGSVDAVVCDPPYHLAFMGRSWDTVTPGQSQHEHERWAREALRVLKPGGHLLAFGGSRTYHRLACAVEDAGFEIRDTICWLYGSGFPKSLDVSKSIDRAAGAERTMRPNERWAERYPNGPGGNLSGDGRSEHYDQAKRITEPLLTSDPATPEAERWEGWGTALKPAHEPVVVARKPLSGTVAANCLEHGTGALNVDDCRVGAGGGTRKGTFPNEASVSTYGDGLNGGCEIEDIGAGRWPPNVVLSHSPDCDRLENDANQTGVQAGGSVDRGVLGPEGGRSSHLDLHAAYAANPSGGCVADCPVRLLDEQTGELPSGGNTQFPGRGLFPIETDERCHYAESGGASRFMKNVDWKHEEAERRAFYCAKASRSERNAGLEGFEEGSARNYAGGPLNRPDHASSDGVPRSGARSPRANGHPTVKPISLMRWLVRLVTPPGGTICDPFCGSGSTGCAAVLEGFDFVGLEREQEYVAIANARIAWWLKHRGMGRRRRYLPPASCGTRWRRRARARCSDGSCVNAGSGR